MFMQQLKQTVIDYFEQCLAQHGDSPQGVDYNGQNSQDQRFAVMADVAPLAGQTVLDVACGLGHFYDFLQAQQILPARYQGIDLAPQMIATAQQRHPQLEFIVQDLLTTPPPAAPLFDYVICCGLFHLKADNSDCDWSDFCRAMISRLYSYARRGLAFNMITDQVDYRVDRLYYASPVDYFDFCRQQLSRHVRLRHDYPLYEFTLYVYREAQPVA
jgi:SAM-dependent methyltransferase